MEKPAATIPEPATRASVTERADHSDRKLTKLAAAGGVLGALGVASCCLLPVVLLSLGVSGAWIGNLAALTPYRRIFVFLTAGLLGYGYYAVYWKPKTACVAGDACAGPLPSRLVQLSLWIATILFAAAVAFDYVEPILLGS